MIDSHFHLNYFEKTQIEGILKKSLDVGVDAGIVAGVWSSDTSQLVQWSEQRPFAILEFFLKTSEYSPQKVRFTSEGKFGVFLGHGLHPMNVCAQWISKAGEILQARIENDLAVFENQLKKNTDLIWAIGETGFDLSRDALSVHDPVKLSKEVLIGAQQQALHFCIRMAAVYSLPLILHSRSAWKLTMEGIDKAIAAGVPQIMLHCYGGPAGDLSLLRKKGIFVSFGGVATWKKAVKVRDAVRMCPREILMFETDSPDLPPEYEDGFRPEKNHPFELIEIVKAVAKIRGENDLEVLKKTSDKNILNFLGIRDNL